MNSSTALKIMSAIEIHLAAAGLATDKARALDWAVIDILETVTDFEVKAANEGIPVRLMLVVLPDRR